MYVRGYLQGSENGRVVTIALVATSADSVPSSNLVFDEGTESADIATNGNILLLDEYSKVKLF
jgi:hypothetical protein